MHLNKSQIESEKHEGQWKKGESQDKITEDTDRFFAADCISKHVLGLTLKKQ